MPHLKNGPVRDLIKQYGLLLFTSTSFSVLLVVRKFTAVTSCGRLLLS